MQRTKDLLASFGKMATLLESYQSCQDSNHRSICELEGIVALALDIGLIASDSACLKFSIPVQRSLTRPTLGVELYIRMGKHSVPFSSDELNELYRSLET